MILKEKLNEKKHHRKIIYRVKCHEVNSQMLWRGPLKQQLSGVFPDRLKQAQVTPLYKKNDPLEKTNYRPVSVLPILSKLYETVLEIQLSDFFDNIVGFLKFKVNNRITMLLNF
jgi:hypothetical protein